ncbi:MAG: c-type cytochrome, methanol metabolism-related [Kiloniellales bacterium]
MRSTAPTLILLVFLTGAVALSSPDTGWAQSGETEKSETGKYYDAEGDPTYHVADDGTVDWYTYSGFRRYHSECHVCHGPDGLGSSFAPPLVHSMERMSYTDFAEVVVNGRENVNTANQSKMPAFGLNPNVMCYLEDIFIYLKARSEGAVGRGRPAKKEAKNDAAKAEEDSCMGS